MRIGIRVLYKGAKGRMEGARGKLGPIPRRQPLTPPKARRLLKSMSVKQGIKYDSPESRLEIPTFIAFHNLNTAEILDPIDSFRMYCQAFRNDLA